LSRAKGNGSPPDEGPVKINVVDRRHHAREGEKGAADAGGPRYPAVVEELRARVEQAEKRAREAMTRAESEIDAVRERLQRDVDRRVRDGKSALLAALIEVVDNLDRAARAAAGAPAAVSAGIDLIRQQMLALLKSEDVTPIETLGLEYDPNVAEAVAIDSVEPDRDNQVLEEIQRGYRHGPGVLRPARVRVGKTAARTPSQD